MFDVPHREHDKQRSWSVFDQAKIFFSMEIINFESFIMIWKKSKH